MVYFIQIIGIIAFLIAAYAFLQSDTKKTYKILAVKNVFMALHWIGMGNPYMVFIEIVIGLRNISSAYAPKAFAIIGAVLFIIITGLFYHFNPPDSYWDYTPFIASSLWGLTVVFRDRIMIFRLAVLLPIGLYIFYFSTISFSIGALLEPCLILCSMTYATARELGIIKPIQLNTATATASS